MGRVSDMEISSPPKIAHGKKSLPPKGLEGKLLEIWLSNLLLYLPLSATPFIQVFVIWTKADKSSRITYRLDCQSCQKCFRDLHHNFYQNF